ncbi:MAG: hypothetical protein NTY38_11840, partial [Acidobacteria bacterium]|nr:hypothetical protein [Acidobacteriota bacterium]
MNHLLLSIVVLFSGADGKLAETTARETASYLGRLYRADVRCVRDGTPADAGNAEVVVALGRAADALDPRLPVLAADELHVRVRENGRRWEVLLRGATPVTARAAAMRFLEQRGVLFGPLQDFLPDQAAEPKLAAAEIRERPRRPLFGPHYWLNFPMDPSAFTREDWTRLVSGWSRMRATVMGYHFYQSFPWYDVEMRGFKDHSGYFFYGQRHPLAPEPELRYAIRNRRDFVSGDVEAFAEDSARVHAWAQETMRLAMAQAHQLGMKNSLTMEPFGGGVPAAYTGKMKEWNGGRAVDPKDRFHPLMREYVVSAIRSILQTYPDLDILKLVSGEGVRREGTALELKAYITELVGGKLEDPQGHPVTLPEGVRALGTVADALTSCKLAGNALAEARRQGLLRPGLEVAVGAYPGSDLKIHGALFALAGRVAGDPSIKLHFLPAHGMARSAQAMQLAPPGGFGGRKLEISGWTEFDGMMYLPQSCVKAIHAMNQVLETVPAEALYAIQWRVAATTFDNAFFTRSQWDPALTPERFWSGMEPLFGKGGSSRLREGMELLETDSGMDYTFCYLGTWSGLLPEERNGRKPGTTAAPDERKEYFVRVRDLIVAAGQQASSHDGKRLAHYFTNKLECAGIHAGYWREAVLAQQAPETVRSHALNMLESVRQYLQHYQEVMLDRTDEG